MRLVYVLVAGVLLAGCDKLTGAADQKIADAEAIGFACRVSGKTPEACMKENEAQSPSSVLDGWKSADEDIKNGKLDPGMSNVASSHAEGDAAPAGVDEKPAEDKKAEQKKDGETADPRKDEKPADTAAEEKPKH